MIIQKTALAGLLLLSVAACAAPYPAPLCDREAQEWNKFETQEDICARPAQPVFQPIDPRPRRAPRPDRPLPAPTDEPEAEPPVAPEPPVDPEPEDEPEAEKEKSDNSDANGKGGNAHDRDDKTDGGTETAEEKKD